MYQFLNRSSSIYFTKVWFYINSTNSIRIYMLISFKELVPALQNNAKTTLIDDHCLPFWHFVIETISLKPFYRSCHCHLEYINRIVNLMSQTKTLKGYFLYNLTCALKYKLKQLYFKTFSLELSSILFLWIFDPIIWRWNVARKNNQKHLKATFCTPCFCLFFFPFNSK
jgi:hypothetical protein